MVLGLKSLDFHGYHSSNNLASSHGHNIAIDLHITLEENWVFVTNQFATSCDYLTFTTIVGYIYNYFLHLVLLATTL